MIMSEIHQMTSSEIEGIIFQGRRMDELVGMPVSVAEEIIDHPGYEFLEEDLKDWAWEAMASELDKAY